MTSDMFRALMGPQTSRRNKMALLARCLEQGYDVDWQWDGVPYNSRLRISFCCGPLLQCESYDEDIRPFLEDK